MLDYVPRRCNPRRLLLAQFVQLFKSRSIGEVKNSVRGLAIVTTNYRCYNAFFKRELTLTARYDSFEDVKNAGLRADVYMTGSDQVWNSIHNRGIDEVFFLKFAPDGARKVSYSASFGKDRLDEWELDETRRLLARYDAISVRELSGKRIVGELGLPCEVVLDPTFLLNREMWSKRIIPHHEKDRYVLVYSVEPDKQSVIRVARWVADRLHAKVYMVEWGRKPYPGVDKMVCLVDPLKLMDYFLRAEFVVASSFHGTAISLNLCKPFVSLVPENFSTRARSILEIVKLQDRLIAPEEFDIDKALTPIDYREVTHILDRERKKSLDFLKTSITADEADL